MQSSLAATSKLAMTVLIMHMLTVESKVTRRPPIVVLPGILSSRLWASLENATDAPIFCPRNAKRYDIWVSDKQFLLPPCFYNRMVSTLNGSSCVSNSPGVTVGPVWVW